MLSSIKLHVKLRVFYSVLIEVDIVDIQYINRIGYFVHIQQFN